MIKINEAIILAGGLGTRLAHEIPNICKPMAPICGQPFLKILLNKLILKSKGRIQMSVYVHGDNLEQKENHPTKYRDDVSKQYLKEIRQKYNEWKTANLSLYGPVKSNNENDYKIIEERVKLFNEYKNFLDQQQYAEQFDSRSNLHSSALEEFMYYLFRDLVLDYSQHALIGKSHAFKDIFFRSANYYEMITQPHTMIEKKDHDFVIGATINASFQCDGMTIIENESFDMPAVAIECKTYLDKTMLEGASTAAEQLKSRNPNAIYYVVAERLKLTEVLSVKLDAPAPCRLDAPDLDLICYASADCLHQHLQVI